HLYALLPFCATCRLDMIVPADPSAIGKVTDGGVRVLRDAARVDDTNEMAIELALQEALANAVRHGCKGDSSKQVQCCVSCDEAGEGVSLLGHPGHGAS